MLSADTTDILLLSRNQGNRAREVAEGQTLKLKGKMFLSNVCPYRARYFLVALVRFDSKNEHSVTMRFQKSALEDGGGKDGKR